MVVATINGKAVSWAKPGSGAAATGATPAQGTAAVPTSVGAVSGGDWTRTGYYDAKTQHLDGLTFLNHMGGTSGSGVWDQ